MRDDAWHGSEDYPGPSRHHSHVRSFGMWEREMQEVLGPPWTKFDTFVRRLVMVGAAVLVWTLIFTVGYWVGYIAIKGSL